MLQNEKISLIEGMPTEVRAYSIKSYRTHWHEGCIELVFVFKGSLDLMAVYDSFTWTSCRN
ncbi:MAG: hypothetical protein GX663_02575 [Clostridiales bacterium]|nr:hypothetical protein [Clostridiales bacterium]